MPPKCTVCIHAKRAAIDRALLDGSGSLRDIAGQFSVSRNALDRHKKAHLPERMAEVAERNAEADIRTAIDVVRQLKAINGASLSILKEARDAKDGSLALQATDRILKQIELQAKLIDLINDGDTINIAISPEWVQVRTLIIAALQPYPEARQSVTMALSSIEGGKRRAVA